MFHRLLICLVLLLTMPMARAEQQLQLASTDYPPYFSSALPEGGTLTALTRAAFKAAGYDITLVFLPWARLMLEVERGKYDGVVAVWYKADREHFLALSAPVVDTHVGFYGRASLPLDVGSLQNLRTRSIGTVRGYANPTAFDAAGLKTEEVVNDLSNLRKLDKGRLDLVLIDKALAQYLVSQEWPTGNANLMWREPGLQTMPLHIGIARSRPNHASLLNDFNRGLAEIRRTGEYARILKRLPLTSE